MHVTCPSCRTTYRVPAPYRSQRHPTFECAACGHLFEPDANAPEWDDDEPFVMDDDDAVATTMDTPDFDAGEDEIAPDATDDGLELDEVELEDEDAEASDEDRRDRGRSRSASKRRRPSGRGPRAPRSTPARFAVRSLLAVVIFYGIVGVYVATFPESSRAAMQRIPLVGTSLARTPLGLGQIELGDVTASLQPLAGSDDDGSALIVMATVTNHAAVTVERIDLAIDLDGDEPRTEQRACTGTVLNVSPFKRGELELMAGYNGSRVAQIPPRGSATCQSIFLDYPAGLRSVRVRVSGAQGR